MILSVSERERALFAVSGVYCRGNMLSVMSRLHGDTVIGVDGLLTRPKSVVKLCGLVRVMTLC